MGKKEILLESYDVLKDELRSNYEDIKDIFYQLIEISPEEVVGLWEKLYRQYEELFKKDLSNSDNQYGPVYIISDELLTDLMVSSHFENFKEYLVESDLLMKVLYEYSPFMGPDKMRLISDLIKDEKYGEAGQLLQMAMNNKNRNEQTGEVLSELIDKLCDDCKYGSWFHMEYEHREMPKEVVEMIEMYGKSITDKTQRAKFNVALLKIV